MCVSNALSYSLITNGDFSASSRRIYFGLTYDFFNKHRTISISQRLQECVSSRSPEDFDKEIKRVCKEEKVSLAAAMANDDGDSTENARSLMRAAMESEFKQLVGSAEQLVERYSGAAAAPAFTSSSSISPFPFRHLS